MSSIFVQSRSSGKTSPDTHLLRIIHDWTRVLTATVVVILIPLSITLIDRLKLICMAAFVARVLHRLPHVLLMAAAITVLPLVDLAICIVITIAQEAVAMDHHRLPIVCIIDSMYCEPT